MVWSDADSHRQVYQDEAGWPWDVLWLARRAAQHSGITNCYYGLDRVRRGGRGIRPRSVILKLVCGPGDNGEPVITIMLPDEY